MGFSSSESSFAVHDERTVANATNGRYFYHFLIANITRMVEDFQDSPLNIDRYHFSMFAIRGKGEAVPQPKPEGPASSASRELFDFVDYGRAP